MNEDRRAEEAREEVPEELSDRLDTLGKHLVEDVPSDKEGDTRDDDRST
jgi:hypothetical protein